MLSDSGRVRKNNEDACAFSPSAGVFVVCDGMGGAAAGEVASRLAADTFLQNLVNSTSETPAPKPQAALTAAINAANQAVFQHARQNPPLAGMGTTLVALFHTSSSLEAASSEAHELWLTHVGDSRCYRLRDGRLALLTADHSVVEDQLRAGQITPEQAAHSPLRNLITRAIGSHPHVDSEIQNHSMLPGDLYLLASDGLTRELSDDDLTRILTSIPAPANEPILNAACESLVAAANFHGGHDNITVILVAVPT
jgi:serine/threonine protein phosphatase PrpC